MIIEAQWLPPQSTQVSVSFDVTMSSYVHQSASTSGCCIEYICRTVNSNKKITRFNVLVPSLCNGYVHGSTPSSQTFHLKQENQQNLCCGYQITTNKLCGLMVLCWYYLCPVVFSRKGIHLAAAVCPMFLAIVQWQVRKWWILTFSIMCFSITALWNFYTRLSQVRNILGSCCLVT